MNRKSEPEDYDRLAENLLHKYPDIEDKESFDDAYDDYLKDSPKTRKNFTARKKTWKHLFTAKGISPSKKKEILKTSQKSRKEPTRTRQKFKKKKPSSAFNTLGYQKSKTVYARPIKTKKGTRFIDNRGRYVSIKQKKKDTARNKKD